MIEVSLGLKVGAAPPSGSSKNKGLYKRVAVIIIAAFLVSSGGIIP